MICKECGIEFERAKRNDWLGSFCSNKCYERWNEKRHKPNCKCAICNKPLYRKPYILKRNKHGVTCGPECERKLRVTYSTGENNHQYGLIGDKNASFKNGILFTNYGYIIEHAPNHPFPHDQSNKACRVLQHRLVIERNHHLFDDKYFLIENGNYYLKPEYAVHHINHNRTDNRIENLQILTKGEHTRLHNLEQTIVRDNVTGRIIGIVKSGKNGEACDGNTVLTNHIANRMIGSVEHRN